jgi:hypothetical protein
MGNKRQPLRRLVGRAKALAQGRRQRLIADARAAIARIKERKATIAGAFWDIGDDLLVLAEPGTAKALGYGDLYDLCWRELQLSAASVDELMAVRKRLTRAEAIRLQTQRRAAAYLRLADATPADDTAVGLLAQGVAMPGGRLAAHASIRAVEAAAKRFRQKRAAKRRRGRTTTPEERALANGIGAALRKAGVVAKVEVLATLPGKPSKLRIEISVDDISALKRSLPSAKSVKNR